MTGPSRFLVSSHVMCGCGQLSLSLLSRQGSGPAGERAPLSSELTLCVRVWVLSPCAAIGGTGGVAVRSGRNGPHQCISTRVSRVSYHHVQYTHQ